METVPLSAELLRIVNSAEEILRRVSAEESRVAALAGGWSRKQVMGHLIDSASNNHQRFVRASLQDSLEFPGYDQNGCARRTLGKLQPLSRARHCTSAACQAGRPLSNWPE
jgi:hypothetical protein